MKKILLATLIFSYSASALAQTAKVSKVVEAETNFNKVVAAKGIKEGFLSVADADGFVFKPNPVKITSFMPAWINNRAPQNKSLNLPVYLQTATWPLLQALILTKMAKQKMTRFMAIMFLYGGQMPITN